LTTPDGPLGGFAHTPEDLIDPRNPDVSGLRVFANDEWPLEIYIPVDVLRDLVIENYDRLREQRENGDRDPVIRELNDQLAEQREGFLRALEEHPAEHVFVRMVPLNPFEEEE
jgi:hypothetical protein